MDSWNSPYSEVLCWGRTDNPLPDQDWDLALINTLSIDEFDQMIADTSIKEDARHFFIGCLYTLVGDAVRTNDQEAINAVLAFCKKTAPLNMYLGLWSIRTLNLIENPADYEYAYWGDNPFRFAQEGGL
ncbi:hypothetical protein [Cochlodiniinecator piscidefendens]|uniref:hypothetical protein n=1 Tax=Cochlodiniinecator piscidefendens TaxID=2715756 RepID=UPI00140947FB|nr:hypothetical protein [Cochlodiniinecator piscidefendens]